MADDQISMEDFMKGQEVPASAPAQLAGQTGPVSKPFKNEDFPEYQRLVQTSGTTPTKLTDWLEQRGYGRSTNAAEVLTFHRRNPKIRPTNTYTMNPAEPTPAPDGMPQPGTPTDWLPDFLQDDVERIGLSLGFIDPKTYYGRGNYGENARKPNTPTTIGNPDLLSWGERFSRSVGETFSDEGGGVNAYLLRANDDTRGDEAIRNYGSSHNWTGDQIDAAIKREKEDRSRAIEEVRSQRAIRDNDEVRRAEGLGVDETGKARSGWGGYLSRGSADLAGAIVGDANPTYVFAPEVKGVSALVERAAPAAARLAERLLPAGAARVAAPIAERAVEAAAPTVGRAVGQGGVQATTNLGTQSDEVSRGLKENIDPVEVALHGALGAGFQGGAEFLGKLAPQLSKWIVGKIKEPSALDRLVAEGFDPADLPAGVTPKDAMTALQQLRDIRAEAAAFRGTPEPKPTDVFPTDESRAANAEAWGESLGAPKPEPVPVEPAPAAPEPVPDAEPTLTRQEADAAFADTRRKKPLTTKEFASQLEKDAAAFLGKKQADESAAAAAEEPAAPTVDEFVANGEPAPATPAEDVMNRLVTAINSASKIEAKVQRRLYSQERKARLAKASAVREQIGGEEGLRASLAELKGELPKADFGGVRDQFTDEDIATLFNHISGSDKLHGFETINAQVGLRKILDGELPTASEIKIMDKVFPPDFLKSAMRQRSFMAKLGDAGANALNLPRSIMSTFDLSAPFTQGAFMMGRKEFWTNFSTMFKSFGSERAYNGVMDSIKRSPNYPWMEEGKLALSDIHGALSQKEEKFMSSWAERIPVIGRGVKASERAYTAFLNKLRADTFNNLLEKYKAAGIKLEDDPKLITDLGKFINNATGRGDLNAMLGSHGNASAPLLSGVLFSPRLMASRVNMLNPATYVKLHPTVRREALKSLLSFGAITTTALALAKAGGADVEDDPRSSDFAKIKAGNTRYNVLGGFGPYLTLAARMVTSEKKTIKGEVQSLDGKKFGSSTRFGVAGDFLRSKLSPVASFVADYADGGNMVGEEFSVTNPDLTKNAVASRFMPMFVQDLSALIKEEGVVKGGAMAIPGLFGVNPQTYAPRINKTEFETGTSVVPNPEPAPAAGPDDQITLEEFMQGEEPK
jgi:hypothetical protein